MSMTISLYLDNFYSTKLSVKDTNPTHNIMFKNNDLQVG